MQIKLNTQMKDIAEFFKDLGKVYFVGGCVRDIVMGDEPHDYDMITAKTPDEIDDYIKNKGKRRYNIGKRFGTIGCKINGEIVEITTYRKETYDFKSRKPHVVFSTYLQEDLSRRDFTINSLVCDFNGNIKDYNGALDDIENKIIRCVGNPKIRFKEDPLRILRAIRFTAKYGFKLEDKTREKLHHCRWELLRVSKERIIQEINKIYSLRQHCVMTGVALLYNLDIFQVIFPELHLQKNYDQNSKYHSHTLDEHTIAILGEIKADKPKVHENETAPMWAGQLHDVGKPFVRTEKGGYSHYISHERLGAAITERILTDYKFSNKDKRFIVESIKDHLNEDSWMKKYDNLAK